MKVFTRLLKNASCSKLERIASKKSTEEIFTATKQTTNNVSRAVKVSDEEIAKLLNMEVVPMKFTFADVLRITGQKIMAPFNNIKSCVCYLYKRKFGKPEPLQPPIKITEAELPDCLKGKL